MAMEGYALVRNEALVSPWSNGWMFAIAVALEKVAPPSSDLAKKIASGLLEVAKARQAM